MGNREQAKKKKERTKKKKTKTLPPLDEHGNPIKRKRGRPRKYPLPTDAAGGASESQAKAARKGGAGGGATHRRVSGRAAE